MISPYRISLLLLGTLLAYTGTAMCAEPTPRKTEAWIKDGHHEQHSTRILADLPGYKPEKAPLDDFGGWTGQTLKPTGFFRVEKVGQRWWLVTPQGHPYLNIALNSVNVPATSPAVQEKYKATFATPELWRDQALTLLREQGFNGTGNWSNDRLLATAPKRIAYTAALNFMSGYGKVRGGTFQQPGHIGYPNDCMFAFDPGFVEFCDKQAKKIAAAAKDDPYLLGYFSDNELPFPLHSLDLFLKNPADDPGRAAADEFLKKRHGGNAATAAISDEDRQAWMEVLADRYYSVAAAAIRKHDPNHLYLGSRFHETAYRNPALLRAAGRHVDVISYNLYFHWTPEPAMLRQWTAWSGRPVMITEFYAKSMDTGMGNLTGAGWTVRTQAERGQFYQHFTLALLESQVCVGWHWLRYMDNAADDRTADPSNRDSNKGLVNTSFVPYQPLLDAMKELNGNAYALARYFDRRAAAAVK